MQKLLFTTRRGKVRSSSKKQHALLHGRSLPHTHREGGQYKREKLSKQILPSRLNLVFDPLKHRWVRRQSLADYLESKGFGVSSYRPRSHASSSLKRHGKTLAEYLSEKGFQEKSHIRKAFDAFLKKEWWEKDTRMPPSGEPAKVEDKSGFHRLVQDSNNTNYNAKGMRPRTATEQMKDYVDRKVRQRGPFAVG